MAKSKQPTKVKKKKANVPLIVGIGVVCVILFKTTVIFVVMGMLPSIVSYYADTSSSKKYFRSLATCNLAGIIPYAGEMMARHNTSSGFVAIATDGVTWLVIFSAAGLGWVLVSLCPSIARFIIDLSQRGRIVHIENIQKKLVEEWGIEVQRTEK